MTMLSPSKSSKKSIDYVNAVVNKKILGNIISQVYTEFGIAKAALLANSLKNLGFHHATLAGVTISIEDLHVPEIKKVLMAEAEASLEASTQRYLRGEITDVERYTKVIDTWAQTNEMLTKEIVDGFDRMNPIYMMAFSGARGNISQVRQLVGMRGLMADSQGQIIDLPIKTNFREGLSVTDYIISSYGARKGLVDTALKTADSGYLTRRLVDVAQDVIITEADCGTRNGVLMKPIGEGASLVVSLSERILSRTSAVDVLHPETQEILVGAGNIFGPYEADLVEKSGVTEVLVRSGLTCATNFGICQKCYGWSLTTNKLVDLGEAIGIMAAQSIGEPGTQLTMRTFHTGGVFSGASGREVVRAKSAGKITSKAISVRDFRTRHGDVVDIAIRDCEITLKTEAGEVETYAVPFNAQIYIAASGVTVTEGQILFEYEATSGRGDRSRLTEKATKDLTSDISGKIAFEGFEADEKRDRQGNISKTANRGGTIWVLSGDVYDLPPSAELLVGNEQIVLHGDVLAETTITSEYGGEVRVPIELKTVTETINGEDVQIINGGKELTVVIASVTPSNAELVATKKEMLWKVTDLDEPETFVIKAPQGTPVENGSIIAELLDESCTVPTSGEIRYEDLEVDEQQIITKAGKILFIPEEIHQVSKDSSLKAPGIETGTYVKAGTELIAGINARIDGVVYIIEDNDIIHEVIVRPGKLFRVEEVSAILVDDGTVVDAGTEVAPGIITTERSMISVLFHMDEAPEDVDTDELQDTSEFEYAELLVRPVYEYAVAPKAVSIDFASTEQDLIRIIPVTQVQYQDGTKIRQVEGTSLLRTSLVLQMEGYLSRLKGLTEHHQLDEETSELKVVVLENLTVRRENSNESSRDLASLKTQLLVENGQIIEKRAPLVKTQVLAQSNGTVLLPENAKLREIRRLLLMTSDHYTSVALKGDAVVKPNDFIRLGQHLDNKKVGAELSGRVLDVEGSMVRLHHGRPYLISNGAQLQIDNLALVQQGDLVASLVFERLKTGDIVQGLPKVEELLEGRKPKEIALLAQYDAVSEITYDEDQTRLFLISQEHGRQEVTLPLGANVVVEDKALVKAGQPITDGSINPHDLLEISGIIAVREFLVDEVQRVYRSQGVEIADKHIEIIVRQMTRKVQIDESGDTFLLGGELVDARVLADANAGSADVPKPVRLAEAHAVLLGITKASLNTESFISAASFQETTRVLTEAAVEGKMDTLRGLKENVIIGRLIPAGTGFPAFKDERADMHEDEQGHSKSTARKPSAILEEIESMFGSPDIDALSDFLLDDLGSANLTITGGQDDEESYAGLDDELIG
jgi:DNA-directed RNA polymerase subunit beta'